MKIGRERNTDRQLDLFDGDVRDRPLVSLGQSRSWVGDFFEELTASLTGAARLRTDSAAEICPDLRLDERTFFECKGIGKSGQAIMYEGRFRKDADLMYENRVSIYYFFWRHRFAVAEARTMNELRRGLAASVESVSILTRNGLENVLSFRTLRAINSQYAGGRQQGGQRKVNGYADPKMYGTGWAFPLSDVTNRCAFGRYDGAASAYGVECRFNVFAEYRFSFAGAVE